MKPQLYKTAVMLDWFPKRTVVGNYVVQYKITIYRNVLHGFESYCN